MLGWMHMDGGTGLTKNTDKKSTFHNICYIHTTIPTSVAVNIIPTIIACHCYLCRDGCVNVAMLWNMLSLFLYYFVSQCLHPSVCIHLVDFFLEFFIILASALFKLLL